jgi:hypothetical protein
MNAIARFPQNDPSAAARYALLTRRIQTLQSDLAGDPTENARLILRAAMLNARMHCPDERVLKSLAALSWELQP